MATTDVNAPASEPVQVCAACGKTSEGLKKCTACKLVRYCNVSCQKNHRKSHRKECKRRERELKDEALFAPPPPREKCPICFLRLAFNQDETVYSPCCGKLICNGCYAEGKRVIVETNEERRYANLIRNDNPLPMLEECCAFCRTPFPDDDEGYWARVKEQMELNDSQAYYNMATMHFRKTTNVPNRKSLQYHLKASELGCSAASFNLASFYRNGYGVEQDDAKAQYYTELAATGGHFRARHNLGYLEEQKGNHARAIKNWLISAAAGHGTSMNALSEMYRKDM